MASTIMLSVKFREERKLIAVHDGFSFADFLGVVTGQWVILKDSEFNTTCTIGQDSGICLNSVDDFTNMLILCGITSTQIVYVFVTPSVVSDSASGGCSDGLSRSQSYGICANIDERSNGYVNRADIGILHTSNNYAHQTDLHTNQENARQDNLGGVMKNMGKQQSDFGGIFVNIPRYDVCPTLHRKPLLSDDWANIMDGGVGMEFKGGPTEFRSELIKYTTRMGFRFRYVRNDRNYINVVCKEEASQPCNWFIKAKLQAVTGYFEIYKANMHHNCIVKLGNNTSRMGSKLMGTLVLQKVKAKPSISGVEIMNLLLDSYGLDISYSRAWRTVEAARNMIFGSYEESYDQLRWYCSAILRTNPGSVVILEKNSTTNRFERVFIAFNACIEGFRSCRPMLFVDGTFMKGRAKGTLLSATAKDGNNGLFPVAIAIVSAENHDNWTWFLEKLRDYIAHDKKIFYISDRNLGLMKAFPKVFDEPVHFFCLYHLLTNLKLRFSTGWTAQKRANLGQQFKECAYAPNLRLFEEKLNIFLQAGGVTAEKWISEMDHDKWAVAHSPHIIRYGEMTSNAAESFNSWIREARSLPITYMIDNIMNAISEWYVERRNEARGWTGALCANKENLWNHRTDTGRSWLISECANGGYKVHSSPNAVVHLSTKSCSCYQWQVQGFPCEHAIAVIRKVCTSVYSHVEDCFFAETYRACYRNDINPIPETERFEFQDHIEAVSILPPVLKRPPGRPKKDKRINSYGLFRQKKCKTMFYCDLCFKTGTHDRCTCSMRDDDTAVNNGDQVIC